MSGEPGVPGEIGEAGEAGEIGTTEKIGNIGKAGELKLPFAWREYSVSFQFQVFSFQRRAAKRAEVTTNAHEWTRIFRGGAVVQRPVL